MNKYLRRVNDKLDYYGRKLASATWPEYSRLCLLGDTASWVLDWEMRELAVISRRLGINVLDNHWDRTIQNQSVFYSTHFILNAMDVKQKKNKIGMAYFHGRPGSGINEFDQAYQELCARHEWIDRIQVSHTEMQKIILESGIDPAKVFLIPIGINLSFFPQKTVESRKIFREKYGIPQSAVVIGSFQKDGNGWKEGLEPKLIKGPDIFVETVNRIKQEIPEVFVFLSGPARGYVKKRLEEFQIPYRHIYLDNYPQIGELFQTLDLYLVTSRQEGGPKAILESMSSGVPLVTTRVGQAMDLVKHGQNGWMVEVEDIEGLAHYAVACIGMGEEISSVLSNGRITAEANSYEAQTSLWHNFMRDFVSQPH